MSTSEKELFIQELEQPSLLKSLSVWDWLWGVLVFAGCVNALSLYGVLMDGYEIAILVGTGASMIVMGWYWKALRLFSLAVAIATLFSLSLYGGQIEAAESNFFLKFLLSSQSAVAWMSALYVLATLVYALGLVSGSAFANNVGTAFTWSATAMGFIALLVRWRESYLIHPDFGHIPVSNLYEVFVLFCIITALLYLHYERSFKNKSLGSFALLVISAAVAFILWYSYSKDAHEIQPLVPALQSYWMKIHVPANFIGYGAFAIAAMTGVAYLISEKYFSKPQAAGMGSRLLPLELLDDVMYKCVALGFGFFTIATILGAVWAAEAWGGYWSWDPKETWALIVWLNYAAWLHMRLTKGWRGSVMAWWAIVGLFVTLFAFIGVNMFLSGLHSYGSL